MKLKGKRLFLPYVSKGVVVVNENGPLSRAAVVGSQRVSSALEQPGQDIAA